ncbi:hypothetical protein K469DRAFT_401374 [Zopfia rhizophila CBS 207.26]|uniref:Uncharacterized protein n=1 Tax=Zopfia rhizophila CBS 207.26 TaxID=1314779 RepID=A0A6A6DAI0_9PEZI|nr:hypothetical protein K469DRAFT_401374 [Zopfia rhizophila CBS 207.26]
MKPATFILSFLGFTLDASALVLHDIRSSIPEGVGLSKRNAYQLGVKIMDKANCDGTNVAVRNHDEHSCNAATIRSSTVNWGSAYVKDDGRAHGYGCMSIFSDTKCGGPGSQAAVHVLNGDRCVNFGFTPRCVVVASRNKDGGCNIRGPDC